MSELPESFEENRRFGGAMGDDDEAQRKAEERERKKAEVRKRLEESKKKAKKGFLTPERKKKLRKLLMMKAAEDLKQQQLKREQERQNALSSRIPKLPDIDSIDDKSKLESIYNDLFEKMVKLEESKYDINAAVAAKDAEINELTIAVNDLRGKFVKPSLKKVSKYDNKFKKMAEQQSKGAEKADFRGQLKVVKKENVLEDVLKKTAKLEKPEWSNKNKDAAPPKPKEEKEKKTEEASAEEPEEEEEADEEEEE